MKEQLLEIVRDFRRKADFQTSMAADMRWPESVRHAHEAAAVVYRQEANALEATALLPQQPEAVAWYVFADTEHWVTLDEDEAAANRDSGFQVRPLVYGDMSPAEPAVTKQPEADGAVAYDRDLIAAMLEDLRTRPCPAYGYASIDEQITYLRAADNTDAAGVRTAITTPTAADARDGDVMELVEADRALDRLLNMRASPFPVPNFQGLVNAAHLRRDLALAKFEAARSQSDRSGVEGND